MAGLEFEKRHDAPTIEVRVWRHGKLVHAQLCESEDEASSVVEEWEEEDGVTCEVDDLSVRHRRGEILEPEPPEPVGDDYQEQAEVNESEISRYED